MNKINKYLWVLIIFAAYSRGADRNNRDSSKKCNNCCFLPKNFENGKYSPRFHEDTLIVEENTYLTFKCRPKYNLKGTRMTICKLGKWIPDIPKCVAKSCQPPPLLDNGEPVIEFHMKNFPIGTRIRYQCDEGYELHGGKELECTKNGSHFMWSGERPICSAIPKCEDLGVSVDGYRFGDCCYKESVLRYVCNEGFTLIGSETIECLGDVWSDSRPLCRPDNFCPEPENFLNGRIVGSKSGDFYRIDDQITVECEEGYTITDGSDFLFCEGENWDEEFPICAEIKCKLPDIPVNGSIREINQTIFFYQTEVHFDCDEGYLLIGNSWSSCGPLGWINPTPVCQKIICPVPQIPENGWKRGDSFEVGDVIEFGCFSGYQILGSSKRQCLPNGKWNGELTRCDSVENECPDPGVPINGIKIGRYYKFGNKVKFSCNPGKQLIGSEVRLCQEDGEWSGSEVYCLDANDFDQKESVSSRLQEIINNEKFEQELNLNELKSRANLSSSNDSNLDLLSRAIDLNARNHGNLLVFYFIFDISGSIGDENFRKSINFAKLLVNQIGVSEDGSRVGAMTFSNNANIIFLPTHHTTTEEVIAALDEIKFIKGGGTATRKALNLLKTEMIPLTEDRLRGKQKPIVFLLTDGKANMEGDPMQDAKSLKRYGVEIYCIGITGDRNMKTLYDIASTKDEHVFILDSYDTIDWLVQELINGTVDYSANCGIQKRVMTEKKPVAENRGRVIGGAKAVLPWPWMAALYFAEDLDRDSSNVKHLCGASLIDRIWVLTAAHCFYQGKGKQISKENIIINLGLLNVRERSHLQQFSVEEYFIHEDYERATHHNDIALVKLPREAEFNTFVRQICLPPPDSMLPKGTKFYRERERAVAIGWGYDKSLKKNEEAGRPVEHLKRVNLPLQNDITCKNSLNNSYQFTDSMFCAGTGKGNSDTCKGDSGGPLMQPMQDDLGQQYWTQVGIISWGVGCAQKGTYGFYTHVARFRDWIEFTMENNK